MLINPCGFLTAGQNLWFISVNVKSNHKLTPCENQACVGVDLGIKTLATFSNGKFIPNPKTLHKKLSKLKRLQRQLNRRKKGSNNREKTKKRIAEEHYKVSCTRNDILHKLTSELIANYQNIVIEDLDVSHLMKQKRLSRSIMDCGWYELRRQLTYKANLKGNRIFVADKYYASSKRCSACGHVKEKLLLSERTYKCSQCYLEIDRDLNAFICLEQLLNTVSSTEINACGQDGSVIMLKTCAQPAWQKQELSPV
jgi:putative transposase